MRYCFNDACSAMSFSSVIIKKRPADVKSARAPEG
jgi:hypothetical protein